MISQGALCQRATAGSAVAMCALDPLVIAVGLGLGRGCVDALAAACGARRDIGLDASWAGGRIWPCTAATVAAAAGTVALLTGNLVEPRLR